MHFTKWALFPNLSTFCKSFIFFLVFPLCGKEKKKSKVAKRWFPTPFPHLRWGSDFCWNVPWDSSENSRKEGADFREVMAPPLRNLRRPGDPEVTAIQWGCCVIIGNKEWHALPVLTGMLVWQVLPSGGMLWNTQSIEDLAWCGMAFPSPGSCGGCSLVILFPASSSLTAAPSCLCNSWPWVAVLTLCSETFGGLLNVYSINSKCLQDSIESPSCVFLYSKLPSLLTYYNLSYMLFITPVVLKYSNASYPVSLPLYHPAILSQAIAKLRQKKKYMHLCTLVRCALLCGIRCKS